MLRRIVTFPLTPFLLSCFSVDHLYAVGDPVFGRDLWIIIELPSDDRGRRTRLGRQGRRITI